MQCVVVPGPPPGSGGKTAPATTITATAEPPMAAPVNSLPCENTLNVRVSIHYLQHNDGTGNFTAFDDGKPCTPSASVNGYSYAQALLWAMNGQMDQNPAPSLAPGSSLTPMPKRIRWVLDGVYFDRSSYYRPVYPAGSRNYDQLCVKADSVINIFLAEEFERPASSLPGVCPTTLITTVPANRGYVMGYNQAKCGSQAASTSMWTVVASPWTS